MNSILRKPFITAIRYGLPLKFTRNLSTSNNLCIRVALCGASGGVGQPLGLLLKLSPFVTELSVYDIEGAKGVGADLSHINTVANVTSFVKPEQLDDALENKDIIVITAGRARSPGMTRADLFATNANIVKEVTQAMVKSSPRAILVIVTNPVNSVVPVAADVLQKNCVFDPKKLFGLTTLDCIRASTFAAEILCLDASTVTVPVIGGHAGVTILPIFSQAKPKVELPKDKYKALVERVQNGGTEVVNAKAGKGSATLSTAYSAARFVFALCRAMQGEDNIVECAFVQSDLTDAAFFASPLLLGPKGLKTNLGFGKLTAHECCLLEEATKALIKDIQMAEDFIKKAKEK